MFYYPSKTSIYMRGSRNFLRGYQGLDVFFCFFFFVLLGGGRLEGGSHRILQRGERGVCTNILCGPSSAHQ